MSLYIDLTEFLTNPVTTGIQRIEGEICRYLPLGSATPVRLSAGSWIAFPSDLIDAIARYFEDPGESCITEIRRIGAVGGGMPVKVSQRDIILVPEVFIEWQRLEFFRDLPDEELKHFRFIVYDLLPVTHPEYFWSDWLLQICEYYKVIRRASCCAFISECTREAYYGRLKRTNLRGGVVLPLGCDSLGPRPGSPASNRSLTFSVLGTIEPRKNHELILEAFEPLLREIEGLQLNFIGKMGWVQPEFAQKVHALASDANSGLRLCPARGDGAIRRYIEQSRATIYVSAAEGYGLPPVESLWLGTPVVASKTIPSLQGLGPAGIHYVEPLSVVNLRRAVLAFLDDDYANRKISEAMDVNLPTWQSFTQEVLRWCAQNGNGR